MALGHPRGKVNGIKKVLMKVVRYDLLTIKIKNPFEFLYEGNYSAVQLKSHTST